MKRFRALVCAFLLPILLLCIASAQQPPPATLQFQGLRSINHQGSLQGAAFTPDGNLVLLYNQGDGLRLLKTDPQAQNLLAQIQLGASGDTGVALATDPTGNIYIAGTSSSGSLSGTSRAVFPTPQDTSINSFLAKFDPDLNLLFLTFLGAPHTAATAVATTGDAVFVTGSTYSAAFPTTSTAAQPTPALDSDGNGFVQRFSSDGSALIYSTYLSGTSGGTTPTSIVADAANNATIAGSTSAPGFLTTAAALQPTMLGPVAGFLTKLSPAGDSFLSSTFIAGSGLSSLALDPTTGDLLATGNISPGEFPLITVTSPIAGTPYQSLLRLSADGGKLLDSALLLPGTRSAVTPGPNNTAWITGSLSTPPFTNEGAATLGDSYLLHLTAQDTIDQVVRLGGTPTQNPAYAHLTSTPAPAVLNPSGTSLLVPSTLIAQTDPSLVSTQTFDLPLTGNPPVLFSNSIRDLLPATCTVDLPCSGSAAFLSAFSTGNSVPVLSLSTGDFPALTLRNTSTDPVTGLTLSASPLIVSSNCPQTLPADSQCGILLPGSDATTLTVTSSTSPTLSISLPSTTAAAHPLAQPFAFDTPELDFGIVTTSASPALHTITVSNLTATPLTFTSAPEDLPAAAPYTLAETSTTCVGSPPSHTVPANGSCTLTLGLSASSSATNDGPIATTWKLGSRDIAITGFTQAASLALSSSSIDFGVQTLASSTQLPRFLYLSNSSTLPIDHAPLSLPSNSPFAATDNCPSTLQPNTVCQIGFTYNQTDAPVLDSLSLTLDGGLTVLLEGQTAAAQAPLASFTPSPLVVSPSSVQFSTTVSASETSTGIHSVQVTNPTQTQISFTASILGDFAFQNACSATLPSGASCTLNLQFTPSQPGTREGLLTLSAGSNVQPITVPLSGTATPLLTPSTATIDLGQTSIAEPVIHWSQVQGTLPSLSAAVSGTPFSVALLPDDGNGHGTLPPAAFTSTAHAQCVACWLAVRFLPTAAGDFTANLQLTADASGVPTSIALHGTAIPSTGILLTPASPTFEAVPVGSTSPPTTFTLTNLLAGAPTLTLQNIAATGDFTVLPSSSPFTCAGTLAPAASCSIDVAFNPTAQGLRAGTLTVGTSSGSVTANLTGTGTSDPGLALNPTTLTFPTAPGTANLTLTNTGADPVTLGPFTLSDPAFTLATTCNTLNPNQSCTATVSLSGNPPSTTALLTFMATRPNADDEARSNSYAVTLLLPSPQSITVFPPQADFGIQTTQTAGTPRQFAISNNSSSPLTLAITPSRNFPLTSPTSCTHLAAGATCTIEALFLPQQAGSLTGTITLTPLASDGTQSTPIPLYLQGYANGTGTLSISDGAQPEIPIAFGQLSSGATATQSLTLTNPGTTPVSLRRLTSTAPFQVTDTCPSSLAPNATCSLSVLYAPILLQPDATTHSIRTDTGTLLLETDDPASPETIYLTGSVTSTSPASATTPSALPTYTLSPSALTFPNTTPGQSSPTQTVLVTNSGSVPVLFGAITASAGFQATATCNTLQPGSTCILSATFTPDATATNSTLPGTLTLPSNAATALDFATLLGPSFETPLTASPANLTFPPILLGSSAPLTVTVTNITDVPLVLGQPSLQGDFAITGGTCPVPGSTLAPGGSCTLILTFTPTAPGTRNGLLSVPTDASTQPLNIPLQGTALAGHLQVSPSTLDFGALNLSSSASQTLTLTDTGTADLTGLSVSLAGPNAADFTYITTCGPILPMATSCTLQATLTPSITGPRTATLTFASSDPSSPTLITLTGTGAQPPGLLLTVNGATAASATLTSGATAIFSLTLTPQGGYSAGVSLACTPVKPAPNAVCSLSEPNITALTTPAQLTAALTTENGYSASPFALSLFPTIPWLLRRRKLKHPRPSKAAILAFGLLFSLFLASCANGPGVTGNPYTPPGSYLYQVTATSTSTTPPLSSTVTLALTVQ